LPHEIEVINALEAQQFRDALESKRPITFKAAFKEDLFDCTATVRSIREVRVGSRVNWYVMLENERYLPDHQAVQFEIPKLAPKPLLDARRLFALIVVVIGLVWSVAYLIRAAH
jgi:hypothetical protein